MEAYGAAVILTRRSDEDITLSSRTETANEAHADLFVSLHCNYFEDDAAIAGLECYYAPDEDDSRKFADRIIQTIQQGGILTRDAKSADYYVLRNTDMPAVLIEMGFISNSDECRKLMRMDYQERLAEKIAEGIAEYWRHSMWRSKT